VKFRQGEAEAAAFSTGTARRSAGTTGSQGRGQEMRHAPYLPDSCFPYALDALWCSFKSKI
jgi:hypothetical protein